MNNELELIKSAQLGNSEATDAIITNYETLVKNVIKKRGFFLHDGENDDLMQEGRMAIYHAIKNYDESRGAKFFSYAKIIIDRRLQNYIKKTNAQNTRINSFALSLSESEKPSSQDNKNQVYLPVKHPSASPEEKVISDENIKNLLTDIKSKLSDFEKEIVSLAINGYTYTEIAKLLKKTEKSIDNGLTRIKKKTKSIKE